MHPRITPPPSFDPYSFIDRPQKVTWPDEWLTADERKGVRT